MARRGEGDWSDNMKKIISIIGAFIFVIAINVSAQTDDTKEADILNSLGLFQGTDKGYNLASEFTRAQGATMLVRLLGKESEAQKTNKNIFTDTQNHWAKIYISYCAENNITKGTSETTFNPDAKMAGAEYITLIMRSLGYENVNPDNAYIAAAENSLASSGELRQIEKKSTFTRGDMVFVSYCALKTKNADGIRLIDILLDNGVINAQKAKEYFEDTGKGLLD